jgi:uncharacterized DUF497 family protein
MDIEWDEKKRLTNLKERGVDFRDAAQVFLGPVLEAEDTRTEYGEQRFRALGQVGRDNFMVAYTWRGERRRIISAWKVDDEGRRRYAAILARST